VVRALTEPAVESGKMYLTMFRHQAQAPKKSMMTMVGLLLLAAVGCSSSAGDPTGRSWLLAELDGSPPVEGTTIDMTIDGEVVSGNSGCNNYTGTATFDPDEGSMTLGPDFAATMMACEPAIMDQEQEFLTALTETSAFEIVDDKLVLTDTEGTVLVEFD
jgi:heat shock protein HslJ